MGKNENIEMEYEHDEDYYYDEDEEYEKQMEELYERAERCTCGAWVILIDTGEVVQIADCICGAQ